VRDVPPLKLNPADGWSVADFRLPIGSHNGSPHAQFWAKLAPGDVHHKHRFDRCEVLLYVVSGVGVAGTNCTCPARTRDDLPPAPATPTPETTYSNTSQRSKRCL
jgi:hypothetical protein